MRHRLLRLLRFLAALVGLSLGITPGAAGAVVSPLLSIAPPQPLRPPPRRREAVPVRTGTREAARRRRQIAAGRLGAANGLHTAGG